MAVLRWPAFVVCALACAVLPRHPVSAAPQPDRIEFEDASLRVHRLTVGPGERTPLQTPADGVLIYLTADLDGRMPRAEAAWQPAGTAPVENRAVTRFEALFVELKPAAASTPGALVPELAPRSDVGVDYVQDRQEHRATPLIDNDRVTVSRHRLTPLLQTELDHLHPREAVFVYLRGGELSGSNAFPGYHHARRGDFDVLPANLFHTLYNGGNDPIDFVVVWPK